MGYSHSDYISCHWELWGMNEDGPDRGDTGYEDLNRSINGVAL